MSKATLVSFHVPGPKVLSALGAVALRHEHMTHILKMTIKSLAGVTTAEAVKATEYEGSRALRDRVKALARKRLGEGTALIRLQALVATCGRLTEQRNRLVHGLWAKALDGKAHIRDAHGRDSPVPKVKELNALALAIAEVTDELNTERLEGFLAEALSKRKVTDA